MENDSILIEIAYATPAKQTLLSIAVTVNTTIQEAIWQSGLLDHHPEIDLTSCSIGIFSRKVHLNDTLQQSDRIEIYRPLRVEPKIARKNRIIPCLGTCTE